MQGPDRDQLLQALQAARQNKELLEAVAAMHARTDAAIAQRSVSCKGCGQCCRFDVAGHRLFATTGELALLLGRPPAVLPPLPPLRCPYQLGSRCTAREVRPLGCRTYFCRNDKGLLHIHEESHANLRSLHDRLNVPYLYMEATAAITSYLADQADRFVP